MSLQLGYLDNNGHPRLKIRVTGTHPTQFIDVDALIDTGFTGFLMLPMAQALPLGLILIGTADFEIANGETVTNFIAKGSVTVPPEPLPPMPGIDVKFSLGQESVEGAIVLAGNSPLLGMEFMRQLDKVLVIGPIVALWDKSFLPGPTADQPAPAADPIS